MIGNPIKPDIGPVTSNTIPAPVWGSGWSLSIDHVNNLWKCLDVCLKVDPVYRSFLFLGIHLDSFHVVHVTRTGDRLYAKQSSIRTEGLEGDDTPFTSNALDIKFLAVRG